MSAGIYRILHRQSGKSYVGSAIDMQRRWQGHRRALRRRQHHCAALQEDWNRYGERSFDFTVVEEIPHTESAIEMENQLRIREEHWIDHFNSHRNGYNATPNASRPSPDLHTHIYQFLIERLEESHRYAETQITKENMPLPAIKQYLAADEDNNHDWRKTMLLFALYMAVVVSILGVGFFKTLAILAGFLVVRFFALCHVSFWDRPSAYRDWSEACKEARENHKAHLQRQRFEASRSQLRQHLVSKGHTPDDRAAAIFINSAIRRVQKRKSDQRRFAMLRSGYWWSEEKQPEIPLEPIPWERYDR